MNKKREDWVKTTLEGINRIIAPESLMIAKKLKIKDEEKAFALYVGDLLEPGDIILTRTPQSQIYEVLRSLANSYFDHVAVVLDKESCLQVGPPMSQLIPTYYFLVMNRKPLVLRVKKEVKDQFLRNLSLLIDKPYNYMRAASVWLSSVLSERLKLVCKFPLEKTDKLICTDAILGALPSIEVLRKKYAKDLDYDKIGSHTLNDFLALADLAEFEVVKLPYPFNMITRSETRNYKATAKRILQKESLFSSIVNLNNVIQTSQILSSTKEKRYRNAYRLVFAVAQAMKMMRIKGVELFHILSFVWPKI